MSDSRAFAACALAIAGSSLGWTRHFVPVARCPSEQRQMRRRHVFSIGDLLLGVRRTRVGGARRAVMVETSPTTARPVAINCNGKSDECERPGLSTRRRRRPGRGPTGAPGNWPRDAGNSTRARAVEAARLVDAQTCSDGIAVCGTRYSPLRCFAGLPGSIRHAEMDMPMCQLSLRSRIPCINDRRYVRRMSAQRPRPDHRSARKWPAASTQRHGPGIQSLCQ